VDTALNGGMRRSGALLGRCGGEEYGVILPDTSLDGAVLVAEQLRRRIKRLAIAHDASHVAPHVTISCGVASLEPDKGGDIHLLLRQADAALYRAKERGRDRVAT
ncbi:MAG: diguanylate cyclase, partial [Thermoanaerobaculia bacterium]|nr:diguanylate cyclase [Thermoanaerobaculia bacterium]